MISIENKTIRIALKIGACLLALGVLHFIARQVVFKPFESSKVKLEEAQRDLNKLEDKIRQYPDPAKLKKGIDLDLEAFSKKTIPKDEETRVIELVTRTSSDLDIGLISIKPLKEIDFQERVVPAQMMKSYFEVVMSASYKKVGEYLKALDELATVITIERLSIKKIETEKEITTKSIEEKRIMATLLISSYTLLKE